MKVTYGAIVQRASGRFGGTVHSNWKGIDVVRRFAKPSNPNTNAQKWVRSTFKNLTVSYVLQTSQLRNAWLSFALGKPFIARNSWIGKNVPLLSTSGSLLPMLVTPGDASTLPLVSMSAVGGVGTITPTIVAPSPAAGWSITSVVTVACKDYDPSMGPVDPSTIAWYEIEDASAPYNAPITALPAGSYFVASFIKWQAPDLSDRYSAAINDASLEVVT
jgi:hypothetical protein